MKNPRTLSENLESSHSTSETTPYDDGCVVLAAFNWDDIVKLGLIACWILEREWV